MADADSKNLAKMMPKTANNREKARWESPLPEGNTLYSNVLQDSLHGIKCSAVIVEQVASHQQESAEHANNDRTGNDRKKARRESSLPERNTLYYNMARNNVPSMLYSADMAEQSAMLRQMVAEHAIKMAAEAKTSAKRMRETANDREKATLDTLDTLSLPEGSVFYNMLQESLSIVKGSVDRAEQNAINLQEIAEREIEIAAVAKISAKMRRETENKLKKSRLESLLLEGNTVNMHQDSLLDMNSADFAEQLAIYQQEIADAVKAHESFVKMLCKTADDQEKTRLESSLPGGNTLHNNMLRDSHPNMKRSADTAEQTAIRDQVTAELAIKAAADAKTLSKDDA